MHRKVVAGHGQAHFLIAVVLPGGGALSGFCPRSAVVAPWSGED
jgi:hypothetical protein